MEARRAVKSLGLDFDAHVSEFHAVDVNDDGERSYDEFVEFVARFHTVEGLAPPKAPPVAPPAAPERSNPPAAPVAPARRPRSRLSRPPPLRCRRRTLWRPGSGAGAAGGSGAGDAAGGSAAARRSSPSLVPARGAWRRALTKVRFGRSFSPARARRGGPGHSRGRQRRRRPQRRRRRRRRPRRRLRRSSSS